MRSSLTALVALAALVSACSRDKGDATPSAPSASAPASAPTPAPAPSPTHHDPVEVPVVTISDRADTTVHVTWDTPKGTAVNDDAPFRLRWTTSEGLAEVPPEMRAKGRDVAAGFDVRVVATKGTPEASLVGEVDIVVCDAETHSVCLPVKRKVTMPFLVSHEKASVRSTVKVPLPSAK
jgi:hypothetical protein